MEDKYRGYTRAPQWFYCVKPEYQSTIDRVLKNNTLNKQQLVQ